MLTFSNLKIKGNLPEVGNVLSIIYNDGYITLKGTNGSIVTKGSMSIQKSDTGEYEFVFLTKTCEVIYYFGGYFTIINNIIEFI